MDLAMKCFAVVDERMGKWLGKNGDAEHGKCNTACRPGCLEGEHRAQHVLRSAGVSSAAQAREGCGAG